MWTRLAWWSITLVVLQAPLALPSAANSLSTVAEHLGAIDPRDEGWGGFPFGGTLQPILGDPVQGLDAWEIESFESGTLSGQPFYAVDPGLELAVAARASGWALSTTLRVVSLGTEPEAMAVLYNDGDLEFRMLFGSESDGDQIVVLESYLGDANWRYVLEDAGSTYHRYELIFEPTEASADLFVDGVLALEDHGGGVSGFGRAVRFGDVTKLIGGTVRFASVRFATVPEPGGGLLVAFGLIGLIAHRRARSPERVG